MSLGDLSHGVAEQRIEPKKPVNILLRLARIKNSDKVKVSSLVRSGHVSARAE